MEVYVISNYRNFSLTKNYCLDAVQHNFPTQHKIQVA